MNSLGKVLPQSACQNATARIMKTIWNSAFFPLGVPTVSKFRRYTSWNCWSRIFYITLLHRSPNAFTSLYSKGLQLTICEAVRPGRLAPIWPPRGGSNPPAGGSIRPGATFHPPSDSTHPPAGSSTPRSRTQPGPLHLPWGRSWRLSPTTSDFPGPFDSQQHSFISLYE